VVRDNPYGKSKIARRPALNRLSVPSRAWSRLVARGRAGLSDVADGGDRSTLTVPLLRRALAWTRRNEATRQEGAAHEAIRCTQTRTQIPSRTSAKEATFTLSFPRARMQAHHVFIHARSWQPRLHHSTSNASACSTSPFDASSASLIASTSANPMASSDDL
jgi:hypothetical protein